MNYLTILAALITVAGPTPVKPMTIGCPTNALPFVQGATTKLNFPPPYNLSPIGGSVLYICDPGLDLVGTANVTCLESSKWSRSPLCLKPGKPEKQEVSDSVEPSPTPEEAEDEGEQKLDGDEYYVIAHGLPLTNMRIVEGNDDKTVSRLKATSYAVRSGVARMKGKSAAFQTFALCPPAPKVGNSRVLSTSIWPGEQAHEGDIVQYKCLNGYVNPVSRQRIIRIQCQPGGMWRTDWKPQTIALECLHKSEASPMRVTRPTIVKNDYKLLKNSDPVVYVQSHQTPSFALPMVMRKSEGEVHKLPKPVLPNFPLKPSKVSLALFRKKPEIVLTSVKESPAIKSAPTGAKMDSMRNVQADAIFEVTPTPVEPSTTVPTTTEVTEETPSSTTQRQVTCGPAPDIILATVNGSSFKDELSEPSDWVQYKCRRGLRMKGDSYVICMTDGRWSTIDGTLPLCLESKLCPSPPKIAGAVYRPINTSFNFDYAQRTELFPSGVFVRYNCHPAEFYLEDGKAEIECQPNGQWTEANLQCIPTFRRELCQPPPLIRGGHAASYSGRNIGATATYICDPGYHLMTKSSATCNRLGKWTPLPICSSFKTRGSGRLPNRAATTGTSRRLSTLSSIRGSLRRTTKRRRRQRA